MDLRVSQLVTSSMWSLLAFCSSLVTSSPLGLEAECVKITSPIRENKKSTINQKKTTMAQAKQIRCCFLFVPLLKKPSCKKGRFSYHGAQWGPMGWGGMGPNGSKNTPAQVVFCQKRFILFCFNVKMQKCLIFR
jgi:hypothetical protein